MKNKLSDLLRVDSSLMPWVLFLFGMCCLYIPSFYSLFNGLWSSVEQGHGPIVLFVAAWLLSREWSGVYQCEQSAPKKLMGWFFLVFALILYVIGRSQDIIIFELGSFIGIIFSIVLILRGWAAVSKIWFGLFFMLFMIPLPGGLVDALTQPMKLAVSYVTEVLLYGLGYPIARSGVILQIGQYQLLVADACAGLQTLLTLESMGLLYLNLVRHVSMFRNIALAIFIVPISFLANVIRVCVLTLITYHFGDEAGQGFLHDFAGMVLFMSALLLIIFSDGLLRALNSKLKRKNVDVA